MALPEEVLAEIDGRETTADPEDALEEEAPTALRVLAVMDGPETAADPETEAVRVWVWVLITVSKVVRSWLEEAERDGEPAANVVAGEPIGLYGGGADGEVLTDSVETGDTLAEAEMEGPAEALSGVPVFETGEEVAAWEDAEAGADVAGDDGEAGVEVAEEAGSEGG
jgi:hypothetical protein